ncbi:MAG: M48 family metalloprotease [Piscinibacter sp.]|nr:M48 family metalloprotease [Piscinibacter sp.]
MALVTGTGWAQEALLDFASPGLAWTAAAVRTASESAAPPEFGSAATSAGGCVTHCAEIGRIWGELLAAARAHARLDQAPDWQLGVVQDDAVEAQSLPGGRVVLGEPFVRARALPEAQIAFVLAHEIAHVLHQHERHLLTAALALLPRDVPRTVADVYVEMDFNLALLRRLEVVMHQAELEADETALYLTALAGYPPADSLGFLETEAAGERPVAHVVSTHPAASVRLERARRFLPLAERLADYGQRQRDPLSDTEAGHRGTPFHGTDTSPAHTVRNSSTF